MKPVLLTITIVSLAPLVGCIHPPSLDSVSPHPEYLNYSYQEALIWGQPFPNLEIQVHHSPGREPSQHALDILIDTLNYVTDKKTITVTVDTLPQENRFLDPDRAWNPGDIWQLHDEFFTLDEPRIFANNGSVYMQIFYLNGYTNHGDGYKYRGGNMVFVNVLNPDTWKEIDVDMNFIKVENILPNPNPEHMERYVFIHEVGHSLGLVDNGIPMLHGRIAEDGSRHSRYPESVMYYIGPSTSDSVMENFQDNQWVPYKFDEHDLADLFSFREVGRQLELRGQLPR